MECHRQDKMTTIQALACSTFEEVFSSLKFYTGKDRYSWKGINCCTDITKVKIKVKLKHLTFSEITLVWQSLIVISIAMIDFILTFVYMHIIMNLSEQEDGKAKTICCFIEKKQSVI